MAIELSPLTGVLKEESVIIDFGQFEGKSVLEICDDFPNFYEYLVEQKKEGNFSIKRNADKSYRLYINDYLNTIH